MPGTSMRRLVASSVKRAVEINCDAVAWPCCASAPTTACCTASGVGPSPGADGVLGTDGCAGGGGDCWAGAGGIADGGVGTAGGALSASGTSGLPGCAKAVGKGAAGNGMTAPTCAASG